MSTADAGGLRVDKWLWFTRFFKTRSLATAAVKGGHVKVNGERAKPGLKLAVGDRLQIVRGRLPFDVVVAAIPTRRGPAAEARDCYTEADASVDARRTIVEGLKSDRLQMPTTKGRPDKRTRRALRHRQRTPGN